MKKHLIFTTLIVLSACTDMEPEGFETTLWYDTPATHFNIPTVYEYDIETVPGQILKVTASEV